jgi:hypothetical protein
MNQRSKNHTRLYKSGKLKYINKIHGNAKITNPKGSDSQAPKASPHLSCLMIPNLLMGP